jgi:Zn-dependent M28 family amino/carboxypeptidase
MAIFVTINIRMIMRKHLTHTLLLLVVTFLMVTVSAKAQGFVNQDDEQLLREWIKTIASDDFGGRKPMTVYEDKTVNYLAHELEKLGLEPAFNGSWFQPFEMIAVTSQPQGNKLVAKGKKKAELRYPDDVVVWTARATEKVEVPKAEYVFCGFGIHAPEYGWDDYADIDVKGKIVIAMVNDPGYYDSKLFRGRNMTYYGRWLYKFEEARRQGAAGCMVLHNTEAASYGWHVCVNGHMEDNLALYNPETRNADELAIKGWLHEDGARKLFTAAGMDMDKALADAKKPGFKSFSLKVMGDIKMAVSYNIQQTRNVAGLIRGADEPDEVVVMNAHWDHLGIGTPDEKGDSIYNGAADNASGVASALLVAKKFKELSKAPRRSVLFLFPSSEESGLFGSEYYCNHPAIPMDKTSACLNFESIGPAELTTDVVILGGGETDLDDYYVAAAAAQGRTIFFDDDNSDGWFFRSDHYNFVKKGVPAVVVENGLHPVDPSRPNKYPMASWYHKPSDEYRNDWDLSGTMSNVNMIYSVGLSLSNAEDLLDRD